MMTSSTNIFKSLLYSSACKIGKNRFRMTNVRAKYKVKGYEYKYLFRKNLNLYFAFRSYSMNFFML